MKYTQIGFEYHGQFITDPTMDETGRKHVNPYEYYGRHYMNSPFFKPLEGIAWYEVIHTAPGYTPSITYVKSNYFNEDNGFSIVNGVDVDRLKENEIVWFDNLMVRRLV